MQYKNYKLLRSYYVREKMENSKVYYPLYLIQNFEEIRRNCENGIMAYWKKKNELLENKKKSASLEDIYSKIANIYKLDKEQTEQLISFEKEASKKIFCGIDVNINSYEEYLLESIKTYDAYQVVSMLSKFRKSHENQKEYYVYAHMSLYLVTYVNWLVKEAVNNKYKVLYFLNEEGAYLKRIADHIIENKELSIKTKEIYYPTRDEEDITEEEEKLVIEYLQQEIDCNEKNAVIGYFGKDDFFIELENAFPKSKLPLYYVSSINPENNSYNFSSTYKKVRFISFVLQNIAVKRFKGYQKEKQKVIPIFEEKKENIELDNCLQNKPIEFYENFSELKLVDTEKTERALFETSLRYLEEIPNDKDISEALGDLKIEDESGKKVVYAPAIKLKEMLLNKNIKNKTQNIEMSIARSSEKVNKIYEKRQEKLIRKKIERKHKKKVKEGKKKRINSIIMIILNRVFRIIYKIDNNKVVFLSDVRDVLGGNLEFIYNRIPEQYNKILYLKSDRKVKRSVRDKIKLLKDLARSKYIILDDFSISISHLKPRKEQEIVQLWHGPGAFKTFGYSRLDKKNAKNKLYLHRNYTKAIVTSEQIRWCYAEGFGMDEKNIYATGFPRTDIFFNKEYIKKTREEIYAEHPFLKNKKVIVFAPTYRGRNLKVANYDFEQLDLDKIYEELKDEYVFIFKWHPAIYNNLESGKLNFDFSKYEDFYYDFSNYRDINDILLITDVLITDYSSVVFDYLLVNKPIVYFTYDLEEYQQERGLYYPFEDYIYGDVALNSEELIEAIREESMEPEKREKFNEKFMNACDGNSTERVYRLIFGEKE